MLKNIGAHLWSNIRPVTAQQRFLFFVGFVLLASALIHSGIAIGALVAGEDWGGPISWRKPVVFGASFGLVAITIAWILRLLPTTRWLWIPTITLGFFSLLEVGIITLQKWRGVPSHFNQSTFFDTMAFGFMALSVLLVVLALAIVLFFVLFGFRGNGGERIAAIVGLVSLLAAGYLGNQIIEAGETAIAATGNIPYEIVFGAAGSGKLAHFVGMHLIQFLLVLAIVSSTRRRILVVALGAAGGLAVFVSVTLTAYAGLPWLTPEPALGVLAVLGLAMSLAALGISVRSFSSEQVAPTPRSPMPVG